ncbi:hypothetical protein DFJ58DRAFT_728193 [Suillus subalutaceus]|uniref:uncharacterized protein n=1 Tax=Suillus subalutaceus TaxID=48586 RepID=UPI001B86D037|nr:uncharacterized protein DFJ58DRAFT_728193 [Suillus subalutaceus]KAG1853448.1 hypothetical protein DFJ58DRAFT_728193 [Suillus subalutaceus]
MDPMSSRAGRSLGTTLESPFGEADNNDFNFAGAEVEMAHEVSSDRPADLETSRSKWRTLPNKSVDTLYANWQKLIPTLVDLQLKLKGDIVQEPFRRGLGYVVQWYDVLQVEIERQVDAVLQQSRDRVAGHQSITPTTRLNRCGPFSCNWPTPWPMCITPHAAMSSMFGGMLFGRPIDQGGDIHVATDGNFHHHHRRSAGDCPRFYEPTYFLPKQFIDAQPGKVHTPLVPDEAIDLCENAYEAADGKKQKAAMDSFDDTGLMALICCHDIPLFFANIDSPGEQQKYSIALIEHLFTLLPPQATVVTLYDVGCVLARTLSKFEIIPQDILLRLRFVTTAMHAYGHKWACQLVYNPRMCIGIGLGLSDGEGTERLWSRFVRLIGVERSSSRQRRIWLIYRQATAIGSEMKADLGDWIKCRLKWGVKDQGSAALDLINRSETSVEDLQAQWAECYELGWF